MAYIHVPRHGTAAEYASTGNRIYLKGELLLEEQLDGTFKLKIGDGTNLYSDLPYLGSAGPGGGNAFGVIAVSGQASVSADAIPDTLTVETGSGLILTTNSATDTITINPVYGTTAGTICQGNDTRLSDNPPPGAHATTHYANASDPIKLDALAPPDDVTTLNATTSAHGLLRKLSGTTGTYLEGTGAWTVPPAGTTGPSELGFGTVHVSGQSDIVIDTSPDTLTLASSSGISITTNASTDTVTFLPTYGSSSGTICQGNDQRLSNVFSVKDPPYSATGNGSTDDTAAINSAVSAGAWFFPPGTYNISSPITLASDNTKIIGSGIGKTIIRHTGTNTACFSLNNGLSRCEISRMTITRSANAVSGGNGISAIVSCSNCSISDLFINNQYNGVHLGVTDFSTFRDSIITLCKNDGVVMSNVPGNTNGACQWSLINVLSAQNASRGFLFLSYTGPAQCTLGTWINIATFANSGVGVAVVGSSGVPVHGVRMLNSFVGEDGSHEIFLDTYGGLHRIQNCFVELAGKSPTGPTLTTPASGIGSGITITENNTTVSISDNIVVNHSQHGIYSSGTSTIISGNRSVSNGSYGIYLDTGATQFIASTNILSPNTGGTFLTVNALSAARISANNIS